MNRRTLLKTASLLPLAVAAPESVLGKPANRKRSVRFAYIGDTHILPETKQMDGVAKVFQHVQNQTDKPAFILHGGDVIMDALVLDKPTVQRQWEAWQTVVKAECSLPISYAIGNHDIWGIDAAKPDLHYGKAWMQDELKLPGRYYSMDRNGWHFVVLDSIQTKPDGSWYMALMDAEQMAWLRADLQKTPATTPVLLLSHVPILSATGLTFVEPPASYPNVQIAGGLLHADSGSLVELLYQFPNVKAALSGHTHLLDQVVYNNVSYYCNGAVSGNWWKSDTHRQTKAGYALFDLYDDGTVDRQYITV
jgi:3',5'-cyclic-AMP phosphodiesterase